MSCCASCGTYKPRGEANVTIYPYLASVLPSRNLIDEEAAFQYYFIPELKRAEAKSLNSNGNWNLTTGKFVVIVCIVNLIFVWFGGCRCAECWPRSVKRNASRFLMVRFCPVMHEKPNQPPYRCLHIRMMLSPSYIPVYMWPMRRENNKKNTTMITAFASRIAQFSNGNMRKAIRMLEACKVQRCTWPDSTPITDGWGDSGCACVTSVGKQIRRRLYVLCLYVCICMCGMLCLHTLMCVLLCSYPFSDDQVVEIADWEKFVKDMVCSTLINIKGRSQMNELDIDRKV